MAWTAAANEAVDLRKAALRVDQQVAAFYRAKNLPVPAVTDDFTFLRRVFLVTVGRLPTVREAVEFVETDDPAKRATLVDYLMASPGYGSHMANWAFDLLRVTDRQANSETDLAPYRQWVRNAMAANIPWDEFTRRLLSSSGGGWVPGNEPVGYYVRDRGMPLDNLSNTMRIFLAARMECAQCHDDPFGDSKRHDFYRLAAFTHGQEPYRRGLMQPVWDRFTTDESRNTPEYRIAKVLWDQVYGLSLGGGGDGRIPLPGDYQYRDGQPGEIVAGRTPFGKTVRMSDRDDAKNGREKFADWVVTRTDDRFAAVIANRMWSRVMGQPFHSPVDEYVPPEKSHHPEMARLLTALMIECRYDLKKFQHILLLTRTFQFTTNPQPSIVEAGDDFHGRKVRRMTAGQIWDSLVTLIAGNPDALPLRRLDTRPRLHGGAVDLGKPMPQLAKEVLDLKSSEEVTRYFQQLVSTSTKSAKGGGEMMAGDAKAPSDDALVRASELPSPVPRDHFLYLFGASDREVVEAGSREPNVSQVLSLMNGVVQERLVKRKDSQLYQSLAGITDPAQKVRRLYLGILSRPPSDEEMRWMTAEIAERGEAGVANIISALVMSSEFLFIQ